MKRITTFLVLIILSIGVDAIDSELPDSSFIWTIRSIGWMGQCSGVNTYMISTDTIIHDKQYKQIFVTPDSIFSESNCSYFCAARDSSGIWYFVPDKDSTEYLLYNFNAKAGDTLAINNPWTVGETKAYVVSIDSVRVGDSYKMQIGIGLQPGSLWEYWIEDVGCISGLFYSCFFIADIGYELSCTYTNGSFYHNFGFSDLCGCQKETYIEDNNNKDQVLIYPNPSSGHLHIKNQSTKASCVSFYSAEGRLLDKLTLQGNSSVQIAVIQSGSIIVKINTDRKETTQIIQILE